MRRRGDCALVGGEECGVEAALLGTVSLAGEEPEDAVEVGDKLPPAAVAPRKVTREEVGDEGAE